MTLENLLRIGKLRPHRASPAEIERLLASARQALADASVDALSPASRLDLSWRAIVQASMAAMLARGFRPVTSEPGHHQLLIQALPKTAGVDVVAVRLLDAFRAARNRADYVGMPVSRMVAAECLAHARLVVEQVATWIDEHPSAPP